MNHKLLVSFMAAAGLLFVANAHAESGNNNWLVRVRAVQLNWANGQADGMQAVGKVQAQNETIPEVDVSYFFTRQIATELVLTYPQTVDINLDGSSLGSVKALPPSLLVQYHFTNLGAFEPYVGVGVNYTIFTDRNVTSGVQSSKSSFGWAAQVGADYHLNKKWSLNVDLKYATIATDVLVNGSKVGKVNLDPTMVGVGFGYQF